MARMGVGGYGIRSSLSSKDLENFPNDIIQKAKDSQASNEERAKAVRDLYKIKIKKLKKKIEEEFSKTDKISHGNVRLYGRGYDVSKDLILIKYVIDTDKDKNKVFEKVLKFVQEGLRRLDLTEFFIIKNFGDQEVTENNSVELVFLKQNHTWERIKNKPYIVQPGEEGEGEPGSAPPGGGPPSPGGFGEPGGEPEPAGGPEGGPPEEEPEPEGGEGEAEET